jgi:predicted MFS family arabinose efflux permease
MLMGVIAKAVPQEKRSFSSGLVNAGGSAGQFVLAPLIQIFLNSYGVYGACIFLAAASAVSIIPSWLLCKNNPDVRTNAPLLARDKTDAKMRDIKVEIIRAFKNRNYVFLHAGFFACGFHIAFMATHLPGEIKYFGLGAGTAAMFFSILGACNIAGCFFVGVLGGYAKQKNILAGIYALRAALIGAYLVLPKTMPLFIAFAALSGLTWLATVPPVSGITAQMVRPQNLSTLFGLIFLTHQIGSFFGAWLGGVIMTKTGSFFPMWIIDAALSLFAAGISAKISEQKTAV